MAFKFGLTNIFFQGNNISFDLGGYSNVLVCRISKSGIAEARWKNVITADVYVEGVEDDQAQVKKHAQVIATLLSFALDSHCCLTSMQEIGNDYSTRNIPSRGSFIQLNPVIDADDSDALKVFLSTSYSGYNELHETRSLNVVIELFNLAENQQPMELKLATAFILLENLKATYAKVKGYCKKGSSYYKSEENMESDQNYLDFKRILKDMFNSQEMTGKPLKNSIYHIVELRKEIIHTGLSELHSDKQCEIYADCRNLIAEYILRLLSFKGSFNLYNGSGIKKKTLG